MTDSEKAAVEILETLESALVSQGKGKLIGDNLVHPKDRTYWLIKIRQIIDKHLC